MNSEYIMLNLIKSFFSKEEEESIEINKNLVNQFVSDPFFPRLISFPRTGSHWLRMLMELYFEKPSLVRAFYYKDAVSFTCYHRHDEDLSVNNIKNVIYLFRNPVDTVFSQINYYKESVSDIERVKYWADLYAKHLTKWLIEEDFTKVKTVIRYENLKQDAKGEFMKICAHFNEKLDETRFSNVLKDVSKEELKRKTNHDQQVVNLSSNYKEGRVEFRNSNFDLIYRRTLNVNSKLKECFL